MKRKLAFLLAVVMLQCLGLTACGDDSEKDSGKGGDTTATVAADEGTTTTTAAETLMEVPALTYFKQSEVEGNADYAAFNLVFVQQDSGSASMQEGVIFNQEPAAGTQVKAGSTVTLYVHAPQGTISLSPDVHITGLHKDEARRLLEEAGFNVVEAYRSSDTVEVDCVISLSLNPTTEHPAGTYVTMTISTGA